MRKILYIIIAFVAIAIINDYREASRFEYQAKLQHVQFICDQAHVLSDGVSEQACGDAQDQTGTEYLCNVTNTNCWVELK